MGAEDFIQSNQQSEYTPLDPNISTAERLLMDRTQRSTTPATGPVDYNGDPLLNGDI